MKEELEINLTNDALFKAMIRDERCRKMFGSVISTITGIEEELLLKGKYVAGEIPKKQIGETGKIADIIILLENNTIIIVEMNRFYYKTLFQKNTSYAFSSYVRNIRGKKKRYPKVILMNIDCFDRFESKNRVIEFRIQNEEKQEEIKNYKSYHYILEKKKKKSYNESSQVLERFEKFMNAKTLGELKKIAKGDERFMFAFDMVDEYVVGDNVIVTYDKEEFDKWEKEQIYNQGIDEGIEKGIEKGIKKGMNQGVKKGQKDLLQNMKKNGLEVKDIIHITGLTEEKVKEILEL